MAVYTFQKIIQPLILCGIAQIGILHISHFQTFIENARCILFCGFFLLDLLWYTNTDLHGFNDNGDEYLDKYETKAGGAQKVGFIGYEHMDMDKNCRVVIKVGGKEKETGDRKGVGIMEQT
eukprot:121886_1